jgi:hypothetical protein
MTKLMTAAALMLAAGNAQAQVGSKEGQAIKDSDGVTSKAVINRADYSAPDDLPNARHAIEEQGTLDIKSYWEKQRSGRKG